LDKFFSTVRREYVGSFRFRCRFWGKGTSAEAAVAIVAI
jgi:hypothetical protein